MAGSKRNGSGSWKLSSKTWSMVSEKKSATGCPGTSIPTASTRTMPLTRGDFSSAISAVIQPPRELPMTVTPVRSSWSSSAPYNAASPEMPVSASGRTVPPKPGWVGTSTRTSWAAANFSAKPVTDCGPAPPCSSRHGCPAPYSATDTFTAPASARATWYSVVTLMVHLLDRQGGRRGAMKRVGSAGAQAKSVAGSVAYRLIASMVASRVSG